MVENQNQDNTKRVPEDVELAVSDVEAYQRRTSSGSVVYVKGYTRTSSAAVADRARSAPGRPAVAAGGGRFAGDRSIPVWPDAGKKNANMPKTEADGETVVEEYEGLEDTGEVDQDTLDTEIPVALEILPNLPPNPSLNKLISILKSLSTASLSDSYTGATFDILELGMKKIQISGYSYISKKTGKMVVVNPYSQMRNIINALGGPNMAAKKGVTRDLLTNAFPGMEMDAKLFKPKVRGNTDTMRRISKKDAGLIADINHLKVDRKFDIQAPKDLKTAYNSAMSPSHPLESVRTAREGSRVVRGNESWVRGLDGLWYKTPRRNTKGVTDADLTKKLVSKSGFIELYQGEPVEGRVRFPDNTVDTDKVSPTSKHYASTMRFAKAMGKTYQHMPEGVTDSLNNSFIVENPRNSKKDKTFNNMSYVRTTKADGYLPKLVIHPNEEYEQDLIKSLPRQQQAKYSAPSLDHPTEVAMTRGAGMWAEQLLVSRAPNTITEYMYDRFNTAYDSVIKDGGDYSAFSGKAGWLARLTGERSSDVRKAITDNLSMTAQKSPEDFLAEAWVEYTGNPSPRPLATAIGKAFQTAQQDFSDYLFKHNWYDASEIPEREYSKINKSPSRVISNILDGADDSTRVVHNSPRDVRSIVKNESRFYNIRNSDGVEIFDAEVTVGDDFAEITTLVLPPTNPRNIPIPRSENKTVKVDGLARYYDDPTKKGLDNTAKGFKQTYADYIDLKKSVASIQAIEESLTSEGQTRIVASPRANEDSLAFARAGYKFDPNFTEAQEIASILNDIREGIEATDMDRAEEFYTIPKGQAAAIKRAVAKHLNELNSNPDTWPTPQQIADIGKTDTVVRSIGEHFLNKTSWSAIKNTVSNDTIENRTGPSPSTIREAVDNLNDPSPASMEGVRNLISETLSRHTSIKDPAIVITGSGKKYNVRVNDESTGDVVFGMDVKRNSDGTVTWSNVETLRTKDGVKAAFDIQDSLTNAYDRSNIKAIRTLYDDAQKQSEKQALMALAGNDWDGDIDKGVLESNVKTAVKNQIDNARADLLAAETLRLGDSSTSELLNAQKRINREMDQMHEDILKQAGSLMEKFNDDPKGPTPYEVAQLGKKEAAAIQRKLDILFSQVPEGQRPTLVGPNTKYKDYIPEEDTVQEEKLAKFDTANNRIPWLKFAGLQAVTLGTYDWYRSATGMWEWGTRVERSSARRESVGLLYLLLRLLPSSIWRGGALAGAHMITSKVKSPRASDWPSQQEINRALREVKSKLPDDVLAEAMDRWEENH